MEILSKITEAQISIHIKNLIEQGLLRKKKKLCATYSKRLKDMFGIIFLNVILENSERISVMAKTASHSFVYEYNFSSQNIRLVGGVRKNAGVM